MFLSTAIYATPYVAIAVDTIKKETKTDTLINQVNDSVRLTVDTLSMKFAEDSLEHPIEYKALDSIVYDITNQKIYLFGQASVKQEKISLEAAEIVFDNEKNIVDATGTKDSLGQAVGVPVFTEGERTFQADKMSYNFKTKKGKLSQIVTKEGDGYLRGTSVKKNEFDELFAKDAFYTTCNREHPHFKIEVDKVKVVPNKLIVSGPAQLVIEDVPTPLVLPFGIFPLQKGQRSGLILPNYGYSPVRGFFFQGGGVYLGISDYIDMTLTGDIYTNGSWLLRATSGYKKRYKYNGNFNIGYGTLNQGDRITPDFSQQKNFNITWTHRQDPKARPNSNFSANVSYRTRNFSNNFDIRNTNILENNLASGISYQQKIANTPFNFTAAAQIDQNLNTGNVELTLPNFTLNMSRIFPFKSKSAVGTKKWYEKVGVSYNMNAKATLSTTDSLLSIDNFDLFKDDIRYGLRHTVSPSMNFKILKYITVTPSISVNEVWYLNSTRKVWVRDTTFENSVNATGETVRDTILPHVESFKESGFTRGTNLSAGLNLTTKLYGLINFRKGAVKAIRHEVTPVLGTTVSPDYRSDFWNYYRNITDDSGNALDPVADSSIIQQIGRDTTYSIFENLLFGGPSSGPQASLNFSIGNNFQMKVRNRKDTSDRKVNLLDRLNFSSSYNFLADSLHLAPFNIRGGTTLFKKIYLNFGSVFDPYVLTQDNIRIQQFEWEASRRFARFSNASIDFNTSFSAKELQQLKSKKGTRQEREEIKNKPESFVNFNLPWRFTTGYNLRANRRWVTNEVSDVRELKTEFTQTLNFTGDVNLTEKWKVAVNSGYDFTNKEVARTTIDVYRDLHCWEMSFFIAPFGQFKNYLFTLRVKSPILQDLKLTKRDQWFDL